MIYKQKVLTKLYLSVDMSSQGTSILPYPNTPSTQKKYASYVVLLILVPSIVIFYQNMIIKDQISSVQETINATKYDIKKLKNTINELVRPLQQGDPKQETGMIQRQSDDQRIFVNGLKQYFKNTTKSLFSDFLTQFQKIQTKINQLGKQMSTVAKNIQNKLPSKQKSASQKQVKFSSKAQNQLKDQLKQDFSTTLKSHLSDFKLTIQSFQTQVNSTTINHIQKLFSDLELKRPQQNQHTIKLFSELELKQSQQNQQIINHIEKLFSQQRLEKQNKNLQEISYIEELFSKQRIQSRAYFRQRSSFIQENHLNEKRQFLVIQSTAETPEELSPKRQGSVGEKQEPELSIQDRCEFQSIYQTASLSDYVIVSSSPYGQKFILDLSYKFAETTRINRSQKVHQFIYLIVRSTQYLDEFIDYFQTPNRSIQQINLAQNRLENQQMRYLVQLFVTAGIKNDQILHLDLSFNQLNSLQSLYDGQMFIFLSLSELSLNDNPNLTFEEVNKLSKQNMTNLRRLYLSSDTFVPTQLSKTMNHIKKSTQGDENRTTHQFLADYQILIENIKNNWPVFEELIIIQRQESWTSSLGGQNQGIDQDLRSQIRKLAYFSADRLYQNDKAMQENNKKSSQKIRQQKQNCDKNKPQQNRIEQQAVKKQTKKSTQTDSDKNRKPMSANKFVIVWI